MYKVFQLIRSIHLGGAEIVAFNLSESCKNVHPEDFEFVIVELHQTNDVYSIEKKKELKSKNIRTISLGTKSKLVSLIIGPFILAYHILKEKPNIIHSHTDLPDLLLSNTIRLFKLLQLKLPRIIRTIHNTVLWPVHHKLGRYVETAFNNDCIVGVSEGALNAYDDLRLKNSLAISPYKRVIYNGCVVPQKKEHPFRIDKQKINIAFCGRFESQKGIDVLLERIKAINYRFSDDFVFHLVGSGAFKNEAFKLSEENKNVHIYDPVPNIADKLYAFDYLIMPSRFEGLVLISIEASFAKVPVIAAFAPGLSETLALDWALQFKLEDEEALLSIFEKIASKSYDYESLQNQAYAFVSDKFSHSRMINAYSKLYLELLKND